MENEYLREFTELVNHMSFTEAARALNMAQPTLSKHIRSLEASLGVMLFDRSGSRIKLTQRGSALLPYAYRVVDAQNEFDSMVSNLRKTPPPHLSVYGISDEEPSTEVLGFLVSLLGETYGTSFLEVKSSRDKTPEELLERGLADLVLDSGPQDPLRDRTPGSGVPRIKSTLLGMLPLIAVVDRRHPLAGSGELSIEAFRECELLKFEGVYLQRSWCHIEDSCARHGFKPKVRSFYCSNIAELLASCAHLGPSALIVGRNFADRIPQGIRPFCSVINIQEEDVAIPLHFLYREDNQNPLLKETVQHLEDSDTAPFRFTLK